ncbi:MAG TPA: translation initiation factor IF-5A [Candidatus Altiarchaeales archaeon]|nr:translation initiation factor IF-5A [Candidatus Altiarchaeales archaeon]
MEKRIIELKTIKEGRYLMIDDAPCRVTKISHSKPGKHGGAKLNIDGVGVFDGRKRSLMKPAGDKAEVPVIEKKIAQVLNVIGDAVQMMDMESYETFEMPMPDEAEIKDMMREGQEIIYIEYGPDRKIMQAKG